MYEAFHRFQGCVVFKICMALFCEKSRKIEAVFWTKNKDRKCDYPHWVVTLSVLVFCSQNGLLFWYLSFAALNNLPLGDVRMVWTWTVSG